jgi:predicted transcriptional regulator
MRAKASIRFEDWEAEQMKDPQFREAAEELEPAYQVARLRILRGLTQEQLADLVGTRQPSIARLESGNAEPRLSFLRRVVEALDGDMEIVITPKEQVRHS